LSVTQECCACRAYVVHANPAKIRTNGSKIAFEQSIQKWVEGRVARHKFLRGGKRFPLTKDDTDAASQQGVAVIDVVPKRYEDSIQSFLGVLMILYSAAGKILRKELRTRAKIELEGRDPGAVIKGKL
jgi:4-coumarate--CoA ligase